MTLEEIAIPLVDNCQAQAKKLLEDFDEFYPFAFGIKEDGIIVPVLTYWGEEYPDSLSVIEQLKEALSISNKKNHFIGVCICADVFVKTPPAHEKMDALRIDTNTILGNKAIFVPYTFQKKKVLFAECYQEESDLKILPL